MDVTFVDRRTDLWESQLSRTVLVVWSSPSPLTALAIGLGLPAPLGTGNSQPGLRSPFRVPDRNAKFAGGGRGVH